MSKINPFTQFLTLLIISLGTAFIIHVSVLENIELPKYGDNIVLSYIVNAVLAAVIYASLFFFKEKLKNQIGFLFMGGSFLKFIFFFILFYPSYKADGEMSRIEFFAFFIPYLICLLLETVFTAKMLNKLD